MKQDDRWVRLANELATALREFADSASDEQDEPQPAVAEQPPRPADEHALGKRQQQIVEVAGLASEEGLKTAEVAAAVAYEVPNTYTALQALARSQVVEQVPGKEPQHWRLVRRYRASSRVFTRLAAAVGPGEWTTPGDVSVAALGDLRAADGIARAGLSHRILADEPPTDDVRRRLADEGLAFGNDGRADPRQRVSWDELARRGAASETRRRTMTKAILNYVQIPAVDLEESATFYEQVFGWTITRHAAPPGGIVDQTGYVGFADSTGHAGGEFVLDRQPSREPGLLPCIAVDSIEHTLEEVVAYGGTVVRPRTPIVDGVDWEAIFHDPAGNALGLFEEAER